MLTEREYNILVRCFSQCSSMHSLPFVWNAKKSKLEVATSTVNKFFCYSTILLYVISTVNSGFGVSAMYEERKTLGSVRGEFFIGVAYFAGFIILGSFHVNFLIHKHNITNFINRLIRLNLHLNAENAMYECTAKFEPASEKPTLKEWLLWALAYLIYMGTITITCIPVFDPTLPFFLQWNVPTQNQGIVSVSLVTLYEFYYHFRATQTFIPLLFCQVLWISSATSWLRAIREKPWKMEIKLRLFRTLTLLQTQYNQSFLQIPNAGLQFMLILLIVLGNYGTIRLVNKIHIAAYLFFPWVAIYLSATLFAACILASKIYILSTAFLELKLDKGQLINQLDVQRHMEREKEILMVTILEFKGLRAMEFKISRFFPIRKHTLMIMMYWITTHTVNMFLASS